jgi:Mycolic acid cyclopropane synthetase
VDHPWSRLFAAARRLLRRASGSIIASRAGERRSSLRHRRADLPALPRSRHAVYPCAYFEDERYSLHRGAGSQQAAHRIVGINLSHEQLKVSSQRAAGANVPCEFRKCDYREMTGTFNRIVSVGMFQHVVKRDYRTFFKKCHDLLTHDGMMLPRWRAARHRCLI